MAQDYEPAEIYSDLRAQALGLSADQVTPHDGVFAVLMETGYPEAVATLVAVADGSTSLYFSNGGGIIGAGEYQQVADEAMALLQVAKAHLAGFNQSEEFPLPQEGQTRITLVTDSGSYSAEAPEAELGDETHGLSPVFFQAHKLLAYVQAADEHRREGGQ